MLINSNLYLLIYIILTISCQRTNNLEITSTSNCIIEVEDNLYLINPYGLLFDEITASSLIKVDFDGNVVAGDYPYNDAGHAIHTAVLKSRPDINVVMHSHTRAGMAVSTMKCGLLPIT